MPKPPEAVTYHPPQGLDERLTIGAFLALVCVVSVSVLTTSQHDCR